jgi:hypothetical protein
VVESVAAAPRAEMSVNVIAQQREVTDAIEDFVANTFVGCAKLVIDDGSVVTDDYQVLSGYFLAVASRFQLFDF